MSIDDPRERLCELAAERGVSLSQLSAMIGRNPAYLQQFVRKRSPRKLEETDRATLARFFAVSEAELGAPEEFSSTAEWIAVPRLSVEASAGAGALADREREVGAFGFSARWLRAQGLDPAALSTIAVRGDSMESTLHDGDEILVDERPLPLRDGIHVVRLDGAILVKRLDVGRPGVVALISDNQIYPPLSLDAGEIAVIGRVVWKAGRL